MYHVAGTGLTAIVLYFLSYFFYRQSFYSLQFHRRLWNIVLAITFTATALAGLFLALQVNYKWDIPFVKTILKWHVEFGIGMAFTGIIHFLWHISYFTSIFKKRDKINKNGKIVPENAGKLSSNLFVAGYISSSVQLLFLKEILNIWGGYELIAGTFLASWLIGSAAGSATARISPLSDIRKINLFFSISPLVSLFFLILISRLFLQPGETPSFLAGVIFTLLVLILFCFISGFTFIKLIMSGQKNRSFIPGKSFSIETIGGIAAGIAVSLLGSGHMNTYEALLLTVMLGISYVLLTFYIRRELLRFAYKIIILAASVLLILYPPDVVFRQLLLRGIRVTESEDTPYGNITKGIYDRETSTYYDQRLLSYNDDTAEREEDIHYGMLQAINPEKVLLISGPLESRLREIIKYNVKEVVYVERDPALTKVSLPDSIASKVKVDIENDDAFSYVKRTNLKFDAVIVLLPPPSSLSVNRYYTVDFFRSVRKKLNKGGVFECSPGINPYYFNREAVKYYSSVFNSLKAVFKNVIPISGNKLYYIASDSDISASICHLAEVRKIENVYVGPDYLSDDLINSKTAEVKKLIDPDVKINRLIRPVSCFYYQAFNLTKNISEKTPFIVLLTVLFAMPVLAVKRRNMIMYFSALSLAGFEIMLLLILQLSVGNMYQLTGLIIAGMMGGLAVGSGTDPVPAGKISVFSRALLLLALYLVSGLTAASLISLNVPAFVTVLLLIACGFLPAVMTGNIFRELTRKKADNNDPSIIYSSDLAGSALGFIFFSGFAVPVIGIDYSLLLLPLMVLTGIVFGLSAGKS